MTQPLSIRLAPGAVVTPAHRALAICTQLIPVAMDALRSADLSNPPEIEGTFHKVELTNGRPEEERRHAFQSWLIAKALQELARGVRLSLEEAAVYLWAATLSGKRLSIDELRTCAAAERRRANRLNFPDLLAKVNRGLTWPLSFEAAYLSLQRARNCLEHQDGLVGRGQLDPGGKVMTLQLPLWGFFAVDLDPPLEIIGPTRLDQASRIQARVITRTRTFRLGDRLTVEPHELGEMAVACLIFSQEIVAKLPRPGGPEEGLHAPEGIDERAAP